MEGEVFFFLDQTDFTAGNRLFDGQPEDPFSGKGLPGEGFGNKADAETIFHNGNDQVRRGQFDVRFRQRVTVFENIFKVPPGQVFFRGTPGEGRKAPSATVSGRRERKIPVRQS